MRRTLVVLGAALVVLLAPAGASAHPLGNFTVNRYAGISLAPEQVRIDYVVDLAEIPTVQVMPDLDLDDDGTATDAERQAWATRTAPELLANLSLTIDGDPVALEILAASARSRPGQGGLSTLRLEVTFAGPAPAAGELEFVDANDPARVGWREVTATGIDGAAIVGSNVPARSITDGLLVYPDDLLSSPLDVRDATVSYEPGESAPVVASDAQPGAEPTQAEGGTLASLVDQTGPLMLFALIVAFGFGAVHALGPGHGKTLMAAYLIGAGGRFRQAVAVGGSVALMHTASVLALGVVVLTATDVFAPERVYPWLGLGSGLVALGLGAALLVARLGAWGESTHGDDHPHGESAHHEHAHPHPHDHPSPDAPVFSRRGLTALAVAGGILPSPSALVVLLAAVAVDRVGYGLALIAAFSLGLASALVVVGVGALRARDAVAARLSSRTARLMPVVSASAIAVMGLVLSVRGLGQI
jgi:ABC-type nickel/cobalt efflux system permease component RcnA